MVTRDEYDAPNNKKKIKKEEVHELSSASKETTPDSLEGGASEEVDKEEGEGEEDKQKQGEVIPLKDPLTEIETSKKIKGYLMKPSSQKKSKANKTPFHTMLMVDDIDLIIITILDTSEDIVH
jgi:hypothetical protein